MNSRKERESGIELLKIFAILMVVISHVSLTYVTRTGFNVAGKAMTFKNFIDLFTATNNTQNIFVLLFLHLGALANNIFFICTAWFLVDRKKMKLDKVFKMMADVWMINVIFLILGFACHTHISHENIIQSLLPTMFANNWYITCYLIVYLIHPYLNRIIHSLQRSEFFVMCLVATIMYLVICTLNPTLYFTSQFITFIVIYFDVAYVKYYMKHLADDVGYNRKVFWFSLFLMILIILGTNYLGLKIHFFKYKVRLFDVNQNFLIIVSAIALFNLFRLHHFVNRGINKLAGLSMLIYIIHDDLIFKTYYRPTLLSRFMIKGSHLPIAVNILLFACLLFITCMFVSMIYQLTLQKLVYKVARSFTNMIENKYRNFAKKVNA